MYFFFSLERTKKLLNKYLEMKILDGKIISGFQISLPI